MYVTVCIDSVQIFDDKFQPRYLIFTQLYTTLYITFISLNNNIWRTQCFMFFYLEIIT